MNPSLLTRSSSSFDRLSIISRLSSNLYLLSSPLYPLSSNIYLLTALF